MSSDSPLLQPWTGPYGGVPPWNQVRPDALLSSIERAIAMAQDELDQIANQTAPATFENTIVAMERSGRTLDRVSKLFAVHAANLNVGAIPDIERAVAPQLSAHRDKLYQNERLFQRIDAIYHSDARGSWSVAQTRLLDDLYKTFVRQGAKLSGEEKAKLSQINTRLARLFTDFSQNVLADEQGHVTWIEDEADLAGLPESVIAAMKSAAQQRGQPERWAVINTRSSMDPFLTYADNRELRETVWRRYYSRGDNGDAHDNNAIIAEILRLRAARAQLLGYANHA
ncbi:MAG: M3 family metallopeptidase, partial [Novipirellula sp. JB048]